VWLTRNVVADLIAEAERALPNETGGVLLGYRAENDTRVVMAIVGPGPRAHHARDHFEPDQSYQEMAIARVYAESAHMWTYLGDWHTHPGSDARPSRRDLRTLRHIANAKEARVPQPIMLIAAGPPWTVHAYTLRSALRLSAREVHVEYERT
jgi:integrative and conjugative element protein (TIGR02256 family)